MNYVPQGVPSIIQPVMVEPRKIEWLADIEDFIDTVAYSD
jgi:hypothetical protein